MPKQKKKGAADEMSFGEEVVEVDAEETSKAGSRGSDSDEDELLDDEEDDLLTDDSDSDEEEDENY
ncbi:MAG: hypothetical protein KGI60_01365 [Patescibacteria group bacterium]|nr:hypothetical protein [Patescibacteria group bacterium]